MNIRAALVSALVGALLTGCAPGQDPQEAATASASSEPSAPTPTPTRSATPTSAPSPTAATRTVAVSYAGGEVTGTSGREEVPVGEQVVLRISSDVAEQVHVHGYDLEGAIPAGGSIDIPLTADIPGVFEVELHESGKVLFQLRVA